MANVTPTYGLPYLELGDAPNLATGLQNLATEVEVELTRIDAAYVPISGRTLVRKSADQSVNNSVTPVADTHLRFTAVASRNYIVQAMLIVSQSGNATGADFKLGFSLPAGATWSGGAGGPDATVGATASGSGNWSGQFGAAAATLVYGLDGNVGNMTALFFTATVAMSTTPGTVALMWAQNVATAVNTTVKIGSYIRAELI